MAYSWRHKIARANHHLNDFCRRIAPLRARGVYPVSERVEAQDNGSVYVYRLDIPEPDDPLLAVVVGELMFNLRSALDHMAVALVPVEQRSKKTAFPIFTDDVHEIDPATGKHLHPQARATWNAMIQGLPEQAVGLIEWMQPYNHGRQGSDPRHASLALLSAFQNADKHRQLVLVSSGLRDPTVRAVWPNGSTMPTHPPIPKDHLLRNRTELARSRNPLPPDVKMEAEGTLEVLVGDSWNGAYRACPDVFEAMIRDTEGIIDRLEPLVRD